MTVPILLTGGTGVLGRQVLPLLRTVGQPVRVLSRTARPEHHGVEHRTGDLTSGSGVDQAVAGVEVVVHCAGSAKGDEVKTRNLVRAATRAGGVRHLVYISVVGADRVPVVSAVDRAMFGYYAAKRAAEQVVAGSGLPWTTLRATQFHDLLLTTVRQLAKLPVTPVPAGIRFQPVDAGEVAERLVELTLGEPQGLVPELGGPQVYGFDELLRGYLRTTGRRRLMLPVPAPGRAAGALRDGANLCPHRAVGRRTWEDFLAHRLADSGT